MGVGSGAGGCSVTGRGRAGLRAGLLAFALSLTGAAGATAGQDPGIRAGYFQGADADDAVPFIGVYGRIDVPGPVNVELSVDVRQEQLADGDLESVVVPIQASAVLNLFPAFGPYLVAGVGATYNHISFHHELAGLGEESEVLFEAHAGFGLELDLGPLNLVGDVRYLLSEKVSADAVRGALGREYDPSGWCASIGLGISF